MCEAARVRNVEDAHLGVDLKQIYSLDICAYKYKVHIHMIKIVCACGVWSSYLN